MFVPAEFDTVITRKHQVLLQISERNWQEGIGMQSIYPNGRRSIGDIYTIKDNSEKRINLIDTKHEKE